MSEPVIKIKIGTFMKIRKGYRFKILQTILDKNIKCNQEYNINGT